MIYDAKYDPKQKHLRFIFPCTGNCGSQFITDYMNNAGVKCGHEYVFQARRDDITIARPPTFVIRHKGYEAESSCFSNPYLKLKSLTNTRVLHLIREPFKVVRAWSLSAGGIGVSAFFEQWIDIYGLWPYKTSLYHSGWRDPNYLAGICIAWNKMVRQLRPESDIIKIEEAADKLMGLLGLPEDTEVPPRTRGSKVDPEAPFQLQISDKGIYEDFQEWTESNGYEPRATYSED